MNGQVTMAEWLIENKNGKSWKKYGKERIYFNFYFKWGGQITSFFYDVLTDKFFGDYGTGEEYRNEYEEYIKNEEEKEAAKTEDEKELETAKTEYNEKIREWDKKTKEEKDRDKNKYHKEIVEIQNRIISLKKKINAKELTVRFLEIPEEEIPEEIKNEFEEKVEEEVNKKEEFKETIRKIQSAIQYHLFLKEEEIDVCTNNKINIFVKDQTISYLYARIKETSRINSLLYWTCDLFINKDFFEMVRKIKKFIENEVIQN